MEVDVVRHDDSSDDTHGLNQLDRPAVLAIRDKHPLQQFRLVRSHRHVLGDNGVIMSVEVLEL